MSPPPLAKWPLTLPRLHHCGPAQRGYGRPCFASCPSERRTPVSWAVVGRLQRAPSGSIRSVHVARTSSCVLDCSRRSLRRFAIFCRKSCDFRHRNERRINKLCAGLCDFAGPVRRSQREDRAVPASSHSATV